MLGCLRRSSTREHDYCLQILSSFMDGRLLQRDRLRVQQHLQDCTVCRADLESLRQTVALLRSVPKIKPPRCFSLPASEAVRHRQVHRQRLAYGFLQLSTSVATVLLILVVSGDALLRVQQAPRPEPQAQEASIAPTGEAVAEAPLLAVASDEGTRAEETPPGELSDAGTFGVGVTEKSAETSVAVETPAAESATAEAALPSLTFARPAAPPAPYTPAAQPPVEPTATVAPTLARQPTMTVPPVQAPVLPTISPLSTPELNVELAPRTLEEPGRGSPHGWSAFVASVQPSLLRIEVVLAGSVGALLIALLWLRSRLIAL